MFRRQIEVIGKENQKILAQKTIAIIGAGGLGNIIASSISCIGLKSVYIVDFDEIEEHNLHRQFNFGLDDIGKKKALVLAKKVSRCKNTKIKAFADEFKNFNEKVDLIFDATDNFEVRLQIDKFAKKSKIPWIYASVEELRGQAGVFIKSGFDMFATKSHSVKGQLPMMVNLIGSLASILGVKTLINKQEEVFYYVDFNDDLEIKKFKF
jgi:adenylyltransferase/sulfurtransferase